MKYIKQFALIALLTFIGECLNLLIPLPVPASIYGMVLLFLCLQTGIIKLSQIEDTADLMLGVMPIFFIAPSVGLINSFDSIKGQVIPLVVICFVSTVVVTSLTGLISQAIIRLQKKKKGGNENE